MTKGARICAGDDALIDVSPDLPARDRVQLLELAHGFPLDRAHQATWQRQGFVGGHGFLHTKKRTAHYLMKEAILEYVKKEEARQNFIKAAETAYEHYKETGLHRRIAKRGPVNCINSCSHENLHPSG